MKKLQYHVGHRTFFNVRNAVAFAMARNRRVRQIVRHNPVFVSRRMTERDMNNIMKGN